MLVDGCALVAPPRFAAVEKGVYRSAYPVLRHLNFLRTLELKTIISLTPDEPVLDLREFCRTFRITLRHISVDKFKEGEVSILPNDVSQAMEVLLNPANFPVLIHCLDGRANTGCVGLVLRRLMMWTTSSAHAEYCRFTRDPAVPPEVAAFVSEFSVPITLASTVPRWLWGGTLVDREGKPQKHPTMRIRNPATTATNALSRAAAPRDAALVVMLVGGPHVATTAAGEPRRDGEVVELGGEMRMLGCVDAGAAAAQHVGLGVVQGVRVVDRRYVEAKGRSRSAERLPV